MAGFLSMAVVFAAFAPGIRFLCEESVKKEKSIQDAEPEKKDRTAKELSEKEFIGKAPFMVATMAAVVFEKIFSGFRYPFIGALFTSVPTPPPRSF
ncbi:hypothetical protein [Niabella ginsenosidivorans]|nr:hypothetical protein [Niabella ginsenosidivorans]